jgi:Flp pilus assembly pilin Flp
MRINKPQLFNGQYLASRDEIFNLLGLGFNSVASGVTLSGDAKLSASLIPWDSIPWNDITADVISGKVNGSNIAISATSGNVSIIDYISTVSGNLSDAISEFNSAAAADAAYISGIVETVSGDLDTVSGNLDTVSGNLNTVSGNLNTVSGNLNTVSGNLNTVSGALDTFKTDVGKIKLVKTDATEGFAASYALSGANGILGDTINIPKDQFLSGATYNANTEQLEFTFAINTIDAEGKITTTAKVVEIDAKDLVHEYESGNGIFVGNTVDGQSVISGVVAQTSEAFLSVGEDGFKLSGVQDAIDTAKAEAIADAATYTDLLSTAVDGKFTAKDEAFEEFKTLNSAAIVAASGYAYEQALVDAKAYTDITSSALDTDIKAAAKAASDASDAAAQALVDAKAYTDVLSTAVDGKFTAKDEAFAEFKTENSAAIVAASGYAYEQAEALTNEVSGVLSSAIIVNRNAIAALGNIGDLGGEGLAGALNAKVDKTSVVDTVAANANIPTNNAVIDYVTDYVSDAIDANKAVFTIDSFPADVEEAPAAPALTGLYISAKGETKFWNGTSWVDTSEEVADSFTDAVSSAIPTVAAVSAYVAGEVDSVKEYVEGEVAATVAAVNTKAVEMLEEPVSFGLSGETSVSGTVSGRVVAVYDSLGEQCYPTITYAAGVSTIYADAVASGYTVIYAKRIGQKNGALPEYTTAE